MSTDSDFRDAFPVVEAMREGDVPDRAALLAGALALETLCRRGKVSPDLLDVVVFLRRGRPKAARPGYVTVATIAYSRQAPHSRHRPLLQGQRRSVGGSRRRRRDVVFGLPRGADRPATGDGRLHSHCAGCVAAHRQQTRPGLTPTLFARPLGESRGEDTRFNAAISSH